MSNKNTVSTYIYPLILEIGRKMFLILDSHQLNLRFKKKMELPPIETRSKGMWNFTDSLAYLCSNKLNGENEREV